MTDPFPLLKAGDPVSAIPAEGLNRVFAMAREHEGNQRLPGQTGGPNDRPQFDNEANWGAKIKVKNTTVSALSIGSVVKLTGVASDLSKALAEFQRWPVFNAGLPTVSGPFAVCRDPIPAGSVGVAYLAGMAICKLNRLAVYHEYAEPIDSDTSKLASIDVGPARIVWTENGTSLGEQWACVELGAAKPDTMRRVQLQSDMTSQEATFHFLDGSTLEDITGHDPDNVWSAAVEDQKGLVQWMERKWVFVDLPCEAASPGS